MPKQTCYVAFKQGQEERANRPLPSGHYKLKECHENLVECRKEIGRIKAYLLGKEGRYSLMHCTPEDMHFWLKELPTDVARWLAYELLPGLAALDKDGADPNVIQSAYPQVERACTELIDRLEAARLKLREGIGAEYDLMKRGGSTLAPLMDEAIAIARGALGASPSRW